MRGIRIRLDTVTVMVTQCHWKVAGIHGLLTVHEEPHVQNTELPVGLSDPIRRTKLIVAQWGMGPQDLPDRHVLGLN